VINCASTYTAVLLRPARRKNRAPKPLDSARCEGVSERHRPDCPLSSGDRGRLERSAAGADAVIAQGVEAGGHVRGSTQMLELLECVRAAVKISVLAAGGIIDATGVRAALDAGAVAAVAGTRFLLSDESHAHPDYKQRCLDTSETILTELFGLGWPNAPYRVIPNGATRPLAARRPPWPPMDPSCEPSHRAPRGPDPDRRARPRDHDPAPVPTLPRATAAHRRRSRQPPGLWSALHRHERGAHHRHPPSRRARQNAHPIGRNPPQPPARSPRLSRPCAGLVCRLAVGRCFHPERERARRDSSVARFLRTDHVGADDLMAPVGG